MSLWQRIERKYKANGLQSLLGTGYNLVFDRITYDLMEAIPRLSNYITPRLGLVCIEVTNRCNLSCKMCIRNKMRRPQGFMNYNLFQKVVDQIPKNATLALYFCGEPLLHPDFIEMMRYARRQTKAEINFTTNGMLLTDELMDAIVENEVTVYCSIEGLGRVNDNIRTRDDFETVLRNIQALAIRKRKAKVCVALTESIQTKAEIHEYINFFTKVVDKVTIIPCRDENLQLIPKSFFTASTKPALFCKMPFRFLGVLWDGNVTACCYDFLDRLNVGNINYEDLSQIWMNKSITKIRKECLTNNFTEGSLCGKCTAEKTNFIDQSVVEGNLKVTYQRNVKVYEKS